MGKRQKPRYINAVVANAAGDIFELDGYAAVGMAGIARFPLGVDDTVNLPYGSELMLLPERLPVVYNITSGRMETLTHNPYRPDEPLFPVAAFNSPGYVVTSISAYQAMPRARQLPLFSYGAVGWWRGHFRSAVFRIDWERRQDLRLMQDEAVQTGIVRMRAKLPGNRLRAHLEQCAMRYGCPAGKNFFLQRYEAPLPTAQQCNARCLGCLSLQEAGQVATSQDRITFRPTVEEIAEVALEHIGAVKRSVVSFGQGCEGDPLLAVDVIAPAIREIRAQTSRGTINLNTNAGRPDLVARLCDAGLDSVRISINSFRKPCYEAYFRPRGYGFEDVLASMALLAQRKKYVSINYLHLPGFTDSPEEQQALTQALRTYRINRIQWRNLNLDPAHYWGLMADVADFSPPLGMAQVLAGLRQAFPELAHGYFNPPKEKWHISKPRRKSKFPRSSFSGQGP
jgi:pyruvate-formate lyase-activating enzyme